MATADPIVEDNYELELSCVRNKIITTFHEFSKCLKEREQVLLKELDDILGCYHSYKLEIEKMREKKTALERYEIIYCTTTQLISNTELYIRSLWLDYSIRNLKQLKYPKQPQMWYFVCNNNILLDEVKKLGELVEREHTVVK